MFHLRARLAVAVHGTGVARLVLGANAQLPAALQRLTVMTWHRVAKDLGHGFDGDVVDASPEQFDRQVAVLQEHCSLIDTADLERYRLERKPLPPNPAMLTFDDGYRDCLTVALPILKKHHAKAVFFIPTGFMGERRLFWWERICALLARCQRSEIQLELSGVTVFFARRPSGSLPSGASASPFGQDATAHGLDPVPDRACRCMRGVLG